MGHVFHAAGSRGVAEGVGSFGGVAVTGLDVGAAPGDGEATLTVDTLGGVNMEAETDCAAQPVSTIHNNKFKIRFICHSIRTKS